MALLCTIFRSPRVDEMYLYVERGSGLDRVPEDLLQHFGTPGEVMHLILTPARRLARAEARDIIDALETQGYYLQMPPPREHSP